MIDENSFILTLDLVESIRSSNNPVLNIQIKKAVLNLYEEANCIKTNLSFHEAIELLKKWEFTSYHSTISHNDCQEIAALIFFGFHEWKKNWVHFE